MGYPTVAELVDASASDALAAATPEQQERYRAAAISAVESFCGQTFEAEADVTKRVAGSGTQTLFLPARLAITDGVVVRGTSLDPTMYELDERHVSLQRLGWTGGGWYTQALAEWQGQIGPADPPDWGWDENSIEITGTWGWTDDEWAAGLLAPVTTALIWDMEDSANADASELGPTVGAYRKLGVAEVQQGGLSARLRAQVPVLTPRAATLLRGSGFEWDGPLGAVA